MNFWIIFIIIAVILVSIDLFINAGKLRRKNLMATGDHADGHVTQFEYKRNAMNNSFQAEYFYHLTVTYQYYGVPMASQVKIREDEMARFFPEIVRTKNLPDNMILPVCIDPNKPKRIVPNFTRLMREVYPETFGLATDDKKDDMPPQDDSENPNINPYG